MSTVSEAPNAGTLGRLVAAALGPDGAAATLEVLDIPEALAAKDAPDASRAVVAAALNAVLFADLVARVPAGRAYVEDRRARGERVVFDHGALRTVCLPSGPTGAWPAGRLAFARVLEPLGYRAEGVYPLDRLSMTGYAFTHQDFPETIPQFFVSELHVERFSPAFREAADRIFGATTESLTPRAAAVLARLSETGACAFDDAAAALTDLAGMFGRWRDDPALADYETLLAESAEAAWIATEGAAFNHATDRVDDVDALSRRERALGRPIKDQVEVSSSGRVRQTAYKAELVERTFVGPDGAPVTRWTPGSFYEFITREALPVPVGGRRLDLAFDSSNAQGIFKMTAAA